MSGGLRSRPPRSPPAPPPPPCSPGSANAASLSLAGDSHAGQGSPAERPGLRAEGEAGAQGPLRSPPASRAGPRLVALRARGPSAPARERRRFLAGAVLGGGCGGEACAAAPRVPVRRRRSAPCARRTRGGGGEGFGLVGSGPGPSGSEICPARSVVAAAVVSRPLGPGSSLPVSDSRVNEVVGKMKLVLRASSGSS